jgi:ABC-2 type transport system permease protein
MMRRFFGLVKKEFIHFYRDPVSMCLILYHFTACIVLCCYCFVFEMDHIPMVIWNQDQTQFSRELTSKFLSTEYFDLQSYVSNYREMEKKMDSGEARTALIIPADFSRRLTGGESARIQYLCDAADANMAGQGIGYAKRIMADYNKNIFIERLNKKGIVVRDLPGIDNDIRPLYSQEMDSVYYVLILHIVIAALIGGLILSSTAMVREKERGTVDQLMVTPISAFEYVLAKAIGPLCICLLATVSSFLIAVWFGVPCKGSPFTFFAYMAFFLIGNIGIGILVGSICSNMLQAILLSYLIWFPGIAITGVIMPVENMPPFMQALGKAMPTTHFMVASNSIFQKAAGFAILWREAVLLLSVGAALFITGYYITCRQWKR